MKRIVFLLAVFLSFVPLAGIAAQQEAPVPQAKADLLKMAAAGVGDDIILAYVQHSKAAFDLTADDIITLKNDKVGSSVIQAILNHDAPAIVAAPSSASAPTLNSDPGAMPAPLVEAMPAAPGPDYEWIPGYWSWGDGSWIWVYGNWRPYGIWRPYGFYGWHRHRRFW